MQTFLPRVTRRQIQNLKGQKGKTLEKSLYRIFRNNCQLLDRKRLGKQRVEALQLINAITQQKENAPKVSRWIHSPAAQLWINDVETLKVYMNACIDEWTEQGYNNNMKQATITTKSLSIPTWLGEPKIHQSHRENLIRKDADYYTPLFPKDESGDEYIWYNTREGFWSKKMRSLQKSKSKNSSSSSSNSIKRQRSSTVENIKNEAKSEIDDILKVSEIQDNQNEQPKKKRRITRNSWKKSENLSI